MKLKTTTIRTLKTTGVALANRQATYAAELERACRGSAFEGSMDAMRGLSSDAQSEPSDFDLPIVIGLEVIS